MINSLPVGAAYPIPIMDPTPLTPTILQSRPLPTKPNQTSTSTSTTISLTQQKQNPTSPPPKIVDLTDCTADAKSTYKISLKRKDLEGNARDGDDERIEVANVNSIKRVKLGDVSLVHNIMESGNEGATDASFSPHLNIDVEPPIGAIIDDSITNSDHSDNNSNIGNRKKLSWSDIFPDDVNTNSSSDEDESYFQEETNDEENLNDSADHNESGFSGISSGSRVEIHCDNDEDCDYFNADIHDDHQENDDNIVLQDESLWDVED